MDGGPWWAAVHGVTKSRTRLKRLSSSSSSWVCFWSSAGKAFLNINSKGKIKNDKYHHIKFKNSVLQDSRKKTYSQAWKKCATNKTHTKQLLEELFYKSRRKTQTLSREKINFQSKTKINIRENVDHIIVINKCNKDHKCIFLLNITNGFGKGKLLTYYVQFIGEQFGITYKKFLKIFMFFGTAIPLLGIYD